MNTNDTKQLSPFSAMIEAQERMSMVGKMAAAALAPSQEMIQRAQKHIESIGNSLDQITAPMRALAIQLDELMAPIGNFQKNWLSAISNLNLTHETKQVPQKVLLIRYQDNKVIFKFNVKLIRGKNPQHLLILKALLHESDSSGFISYEDLENTFVRNGRRAISDKAKSRKRILDSRQVMFRFLGIPETYNGVELVQIIEGKGLRLHNPLIEKKNIN